MAQNELLQCSVRCENELVVFAVQHVLEAHASSLLLHLLAPVLPLSRALKTLFEVPLHWQYLRRSSGPAFLCQLLRVSAHLSQQRLAWMPSYSSNRALWCCSPTCTTGAHPTAKHRVFQNSGVLNAVFTNCRTDRFTNMTHQVPMYSPL